MCLKNFKRPSSIIFNLKFSNTSSNLQNALKPNQTRARFYLDRNLIETIDLQSPIQDDIQFSIDDCRLDILTENAGRINFSRGVHQSLGLFCQARLLGNYRQALALGSLSLAAWLLFNVFHERPRANNNFHFRERVLRDFLTEF